MIMSSPFRPATKAASTASSSCAILLALLTTQLFCGALVPVAPTTRRSRATTTTPLRRTASSRPSGLSRASRSLLASTAVPGGGSAGANGSAPHPPHRVDDATTVPQLMKSLWGLISHAVVNMQKGDEATVAFPGMADRLSDRNFVARLVGHLDACKDVCDGFGVHTVLVPCADPSDDSIIGFAVKSYRNPDGGAAGTYGADASEMTFAPDPFWDDDEEWDFGGPDDEDAGGASSGTSSQAPTPREDHAIVDLSRAWVDSMMADLALCPFTQSSNKSGIPPGPVYYQVDRVTSMEDAYAAYWSEVLRVEDSDESTLSTTLQILPEFCPNSVEQFEQWADTLTGTLEALGLEELLQLIFFHPQWTFRDGGDRSGEAGLAANYARRSPWPMVNILRTRQVRLAQRGIPTGLVYQQNEKTLSKIGSAQLEKMLHQRDWSDVDGMKVNRRDMEALRVANDLQVEGIVNEKDTSFAFDSTPAANKVDRKEIDGGDMVNVVRQALEIRLGRGRGSGPVAASVLNGAQASAAMMASDFLLEELGRLAAEEEERPPAGEAPGRRSGGGGRPSSAMASGGYAAAYGFDAEDYDEEFAGSLREAEEREMSALFGAGIPMSAED